MRNWITLMESEALMEKSASNIVNYKNDFSFDVGSDRPQVIESAVSQMENHVLHHHGDQSAVNWFTRNFLSWVCTHNSLDDGIVIPIEMYIDHLWDTFEENEWPYDVPTVLSLLPDWAKTASVALPFSVDYVFDHERDGHPYSELLDYIIYATDHGTRVERMSVEEALANSLKWHATKVKGGSDDGQTVLTFPDGYRIVRITTTEGLDYESEHCRHCVGKGGYDKRLREGSIAIFSLRNAENIPIVTMAVSGGKIQEMQGLENTPPRDEVHAHLLQFMARAHLVMKNDALFRRNFGSDPIATL